MSVTKVQQPASEQQIAGMFDKIAGRYDLLNALLSMRQDRRWRRRLAAEVPVRPQGAFLDVATGTGDILLNCFREHPEYARWVGVDISPMMLHQARAKAKSLAGSEKISWFEMSAERLSTFPMAEFDCLSIAFGLRNVVNRQRALEEFARVLKQDGTLMILEFFTPPRSWATRLFQFYFHRILPVIGGMLSDRKAYTYLPQSVGSFYSLTELRQVLYGLGFVVEEQISYLFGACCFIKARKVAAKDE